MHFSLFPMAVHRRPQGLFRASGGVRRALLLLSASSFIWGLQPALSQQTVYWRNGAGVANWWDGANPWYRSCDGWWVDRPDKNTCSDGSTTGPNEVHFDNGSDLSMNVNGAFFQITRLLFDSGTGARTMTAASGGGIDMTSSSGTVKIENNDSDAQVIDAPIRLSASSEINPISGNLTIHGTVTNGGNWIDVYGNNGNTLSLNGIISGSGGIAVKQNSIVVISNANTFSGAIWVEKGVARVQGATNSVGTGSVSVGTNATLELNANIGYQPILLTLYGQGTNDARGALYVANGATWHGAITAGASSVKIRADGSTFTTRGNLDAGANTIYLTNSATVTMDAGELVGTKTTGDGAFRKTGTGRWDIRPGTSLSGSLFIDQGELRLDTGTMAGGGELTLSNGTTVATASSTGRTVTKPVNVMGDITIGRDVNNAGVTLSNAVNLAGGTRTITSVRTNTISGPITNGALTKAGSTSGGVLILSGGMANTYTGATTISAGSLRLGAANRIPDGSAVSVSGGATFDLNGYSDTVGSIAGAGFVTLGAGTLTAGDSSSTTFSGVMSGTGGLNKDGAGTLTISSNNTYSGATAVRGGTILHNGTNTSSSIGVASVGFLYGVGSIGNLSATGQVSAGNGSNTVGSLRVTNLLIESSGRLQVNYASAGNMNGTAGTDWDVITVNGGSGAYTVNAVDGSDFVIALKGTPTFSVAQGYTNVILDAGSATSFATNKFTIDYTEFNGGTVGNVTVDADGGNLRLIFTPSTAPDVLVLDAANTAIADGDTTPAYSDNTDFGDALVSGGTVSKTYTVTNSGTSTLDLGNVTTSGTAAAEFIVTAPLGSLNLAAGATTTFTVQFNPGAAGLRTADLEFTNNVSGAKNPYTFRVQGTGTYVEVAVTMSGNAIADGSSSPAAANGTDFGSVGTAGSTSNITYTITNSGNRAMTIGSVTTSGTHAADFTVTSPPGGTLNPSNTTTFTVQFNPSANGLRTASLSFSTTDDNFSDGLTENPFNFDIQGTGAGTGISNLPTTLSFSSALGSLPSPSFQAFSVTNVGLGTLTYTLATNASWLRLSNNTFSAAAGAGNIHTAHVQLVSGIAAGTSNATITITGTDGFTTNSPKTIAVSWTISAIPDPTAQSATADGKVMVDLAWTKDAGYDVMIVYDTAAISTEPTQGTSYSVGGTIGSGRVIYKGSGATLEHVVPSGSTAYYKFYSVNSDYYSPGVTASATLGSYGAGEIVETFSYTNTGTLATGGHGGGSNGWSGAWAGDSSYFNLSGGSFANQAYYPNGAGNKIKLNSADIDGTSKTNVRQFAAITTGSVYVGFVMNYQYSGANKYAGLSFMSGSAEEMFFGEMYGGDQKLGVGGSVSGSNLLAGSGNDYIVIGKYDFDADTGYVAAYKIGTDTVPSTEPGTWHQTDSDASIASINGIRLAAGAGGGSGTPGDTYFDEIRVAQSWSELLRLTQPVATNYSINGGADVTDAQVTGGTFSVVYDFYDSAGLTNSATLPNFDLLSPGGTVILTNRAFSTLTYSAGGASLKASNATHAGASGGAVALGVYTSRWTAANSNGVTVSDATALSNGTVTTFTVVDDDTTAPAIGIFVGQGKALSGATYTNSDFSGGFWVTGTVSDAGSGLFAASNTFALTRDGVSISNGIFAVDFSDGGATGGGRVSNNFAQADMLAGAYTLTVYAVDFDVDRAGDPLKATNVISFTVVDPPSAPGLAVGPTTLTFETMLGGSPAGQTISVTNIGTGTLNYTNDQTYGPGPSGWLDVNFTNYSLLSGLSRIHTVLVSSASFTTSGVYTATNRVTGNQTNAAQYVSVTLTVSNIPAPTSVQAIPSGAEFVRLTAADGGDRQILVVHSAPAPLTVQPTNGAAYAAGDALGNGRVLFKFTGSSTVSNLEHVVAAGSTNFYSFYSINNDRYSAASVAGATASVYQAGEIVEPFSYTNALTLDGRTNQGWAAAGSWSNGSPPYVVVSNLFSSTAGYSSTAGNSITGQAAGAFRMLPAAYSSGKVYIGFMLRASAVGNTDYAGLSFFNGGNEEVFIGERSATTAQLGLEVPGGSTDADSQLSANTDYTIIARYDLDADTIDAVLYTNATQTVPTGEPVTWDVSVSDNSPPAQVDRIRILSNTGARWDEIRVATSWEDLLFRDATYEWDAGGGASDRDWSTAANWTRNTEPAITNSAFINGGHTGVVSAAGERAGELHVGSTNMPANGVNFTGRLEQTGGDLVIATNFYLGRWMGAIGTYVISGGSLSVSNALHVGDHGRGLMTVSGSASVWVGADLSVGNSSSAAETNGSTLTIGGGAVYVGDELRLAGTGGSGNGADGTVNMSGGLLQVTNTVLIGDHGSSTGLFVLAGGRLNALGELVIVDSASGQGIFRQGGGTADVAGIVRVGDNSTSDSQLIVSGGVFNAATTVNVGDSSGARGTVTISGGVFNASGSFDVGFTANSTGALTVADGNLNAPAGIRVGVSGAGAMTLSGGSVTANTFRLTDAAGSTGSLAITGGRLVVTNTATTAFVFDQDHPIMTQSGGAVEITGGMELGDVAGAKGTIFLSGGTLLVGGGAGASQDLQLGDTAGATGVVYLTGGFLDLNRSGIDLRLGDANPSRGVFAMNVGTASVGNIIYVGSAASAAGELYVTGGVLEAASDLLLASGADATGRVVQTGGSVEIGGDIEVTTSAGADGYYEISGGTLTNAGALEVGRTDALGTGVLHIVGGTAVIHVGDSTTEDFRIQNSGELRLTFSSSAIAPVRVSDDIVLSSGSTLTITNIGAINPGSYLVATSQNGSAVSGTFSATNWLGDYTGTVSYANNRILISFDTPAEIAVLGTNYAAIASGDATPDVADGTDYGAVAVNGATLDRTFYITNSGTLALTVSSVATSGPAAADFSVLSWPGVVGPLSASNLVIRFDPAAAGTRAATLTIVNSDSDEGSYTFDVQGTGTAPNLVAAPLTLTFDAMLGSSPAASQAFTVSNDTAVGTLLYTNVQTYGPGPSGWLDVNFTNYSLVPAASRIHTALVTSASFTTAGTYVATNRIAGNQTNAAQEVVVTLNITNIPAPTAVVATNDGAEMVKMSWTQAGSLNVLIVHRSGADLSADPVNGTAYSAGDSLGGGSVIFNGSGSSREHVVATGTTNYYRFYSVNNSRYSPAAAAAATTTAYQAGEHVDSFGYTNAVAVNGLNGGQGWSNAWAASAPDASTDVVVDNVNFSTFQAEWPAESGNRMVLKTTNNGAYTAARYFPAVTNGKLYVAALYRREFNEDDAGTDGKYSGISLFDGADERMFVGEPGGSDAAYDDVFAAAMGATRITAGAAQNSFPAATDYLLIGRYDFDTDVFSGMYYDNATSVPATEPTFIRSVTGAFSRIDGVRLGSGATVGWNGLVYYDEVRIATNWADLLLLESTPPYATNYLVGSATNYVSDGNVNAGTFPVMMAIRSSAGVESVNTNLPYYIPNFDLYNPNGTQIVTDQAFSVFSYQDGGTTLIASNATHAAVVPAGVVLGIHTARWSAISSNGFSTVNEPALSNGTALTFTVFDDDTATPEPVGITSTNSGGGVNRLLHIAQGAANLSGNGAASNNVQYTLTDAALTNVTAANPLLLWLGARDASGLNRDTSGADTNSNLSIGSAIVSNAAQWDSARSSSFGETSAARATNVWTWTSAFSATQIENLVTNSTAAGSNAVVAVWRDADADRASDSTSFVFTQGWLRVTDDDATAPDIQNFRIWGAEGSYTVRVDELTSGSDWAITGRVRDVDSGVNVNGTETNQPNNSPYFELWDSVGALRFRKAFGGVSFSDGGATGLSSVSNGAETVGGVTFADVGVWTARVIVADNDEDFGNNDHAIGTNEIGFSVVLGATLGGIGRGPAAFAVTSSYGTVTSTNPWPEIFVTNIGSGTLNYNATISYSGAGDWLTITPTNGSLTGTGTSRSHTNSIDASSLSPGTYTATITLDGDQTNAAQTVTITLRVFGYYPGEIVDQFTNSSGSLEGMIGGTGWSGAWDNNPDAGFSIDSSSLTIPGNYPASAGNKVCGNTASATELKVYRSFGATFSTGKLFMAMAMRKSDGDAGGFNGISFTSNSTEVAFAGKLYNSLYFGVSPGIGNGTNGYSAFGANGTGDPGYFYIGMYDFSSNMIYGRAYLNSDTLPATEPTWSAASAPTVAIGSIDGIRVAALDEGTFCFDEVRVATSWEGLLNQFTNEPNVHASGINFREVTPSSMVVGWTPGNGANRIVIAREGSAVTLVPTDSVSYAYNNDFSLATDFGGNRVVYNGGDTNFTLTGLTATTQYHFAIFEYNGSPANYYTNAGFATGSRWTLAAEPASNATALAAYTVSDTSISNTWTVAGGSPAPDGYLIFRSYAAVSNYPADGVGYTNGQPVNGAVASVVTSGSTDTYLHTGLASCTTVHFRIYSFRWNGSAAETYNYNTNSAPTASAETDCEAPSVQASNIVFTLTGTNRIALTWQRGSGEGSLLVVRGTNAVSADPADGNSYTGSANYGSGSHLGGGNYVMYVGTGTSLTVTGLLPNITYHFRVYEYNGSGSGIDFNTNTAVNNPRSTATASFGLVEDKFVWNYFGSYANNNLSGAGTGSGWTNTWTTFGGYVAVDDANMPPFKGYPADTRSECGISCDDSRQLKIVTTNGTAFGARRNFPARTSGKVYAAIKINIEDPSLTNAFAGISFLDGTTEVGFLGKGWNKTFDLTLDDNNGTVSTNTTFSTNSTWQLYGGTPYLLVLQYDFDNDVLRGLGIATNLIPDALPEEELGWDVEITGVTNANIDGIRIAGENVGDLIFDHIRVGPSWEEVVWDLPDGWHEDNGPVPTLVYIGTNYNSGVYGQVITNLSDAELKSSQLIDFAVQWDSPTYGIFLTNSVATNRNQGSQNARVTPNWDPLAVGVASNLFNLDKYFTNHFGYNGAVVVTTYQKNGFSVTNINFEEQYFVTVSAETDPGGSTVAPNTSTHATFDSVPVTRAITINEQLRFYVYDDDTNAPASGSRPLRVLTNASLASAQSVGALEIYSVYDGVLTQAGMRVQLNAYDAYSGLQRATGGASATNMSLSIPYVATNDTGNYDASLSSDFADSKTATATSTWAFASALFSWSRVTDMWGGDGSGELGQSIEVRATIPDADDDRTADQMWSSNALMGYLRLEDDDKTAPEIADMNFSGAGARPFFVNTNAFPIGSGDTQIRNTYDRRSGTGSNTIFAVTDEEMASSGTRSLQFVFGGVDGETGLRRGTSGTTNDAMSFTIGDIVTGSSVITGWSAVLSTSANAPGVYQTNAWTFADGFFTETVITQLMAVTGSSGSGTNIVRVTMPDADDDRDNDASTIFAQQVGWLQVFDDDINGPVMSVADVMESAGGAAILSTSFETNQLWPVPPTGSTITWTNTDSYGSWILEGVTHTSLDPKNTGTRRLGMLTNTFPQPYFQLPPVSNPGRVTLYAARVSGGSGTPVLRVEWRDGASWTSLGDNNVTNTVYEPLTWEFELDAAGVTLRVVRVDTGTSRSQVYVDDLSVNSTLDWIGTNQMTNTQITVAWNAGLDDFSSVANYRVVAPAIGSVVPTATNDGTFVNAATTSQTFNLSGQQGTITGYVFAVDNDNDRSQDGTMGNVLPILVKVDTNPPLVVLNATNDISDLSVDETSELKFTWTPNGTNSAQAAGRRESDQTPLSPWDSYVITVHELDGSFNELTTNVLTSTNGPSNLGTNDTAAVVVSNLNFDAYHRVRIAARDRAGNIGPEIVVTGLTVNFQVTQGLARTTSTFTNAIRLAWIASSNRVYDELYVDAVSMTDSMSNQWDWLDRITNNMVEGNTLWDAGGDNPTNRSRVAPVALGNTMRFYRVSLKDAWQATNAFRRGSREVYVTKPLRLVPGENWYSTFFVPDTATVAYVFGTNRLWGGLTYGEATKIHWFSPTNSGSSYNFATNTIWLAGTNGFGGVWTYQVGGSGSANNMIFPTHQGFMIELPTNSPSMPSVINMPIVGRVLTQATVHVIAGRSSPSSPDHFHVMNWNYPFRVSLTGLNLAASGIATGNFLVADEIRILQNRGQGSLEQPKLRARYSNAWNWVITTWSTNYFTSAPSPSSAVIEPDDTIIFVRKSTNTITWTNRVYYTPPGKNFDP